MNKERIAQCKKDIEALQKELRKLQNPDHYQVRPAIIYKRKAGYKFGLALDNAYIACVKVDLEKKDFLKGYSAVLLGKEEVEELVRKMQKLLED